MCGHPLTAPHFVDMEQILAILRLDHNIRLLDQREESLNYKARALKKTTDIRNDIEQVSVKDFDSKIMGTQAQRVKNEYTMFRLVSGLPRWLKDSYQELRRDPLWYMREEMVDDCADRGGCCSRGCGCCSRRSLSENTKTRGHCTMECWCCSSFRDPSLTEEDQVSIARDLEKLLESRRYVCNMANWYFRPMNLKHKLKGVGIMVKRWLYGK